MQCSKESAENIAILSKIIFLNIVIRYDTAISKTIYRYIESTLLQDVMLLLYVLAIRATLVEKLLGKSLMLVLKHFLLVLLTNFKSSYFVLFLGFIIIMHQLY